LWSRQHRRRHCRRWRNAAHGLDARNRRPQRPQDPGFRIPLFDRPGHPAFRRDRLQLDAGALPGPCRAAPDADCGHSLPRPDTASRRCYGAGGEMVTVMATSTKVWPIVTVPIETEADVVTVRQRAHRLAELLGFERQDQTRIATAVSELARNAF